MPIEDIFLYYILFAVVIATTLYFRSKVQERDAGVKLTRVRLGKCSKCQRIFLVPRQSTVTRCPHCHAPGTIYSD